MIKISRFRSCVNTPPKTDGEYLVIRMWNGELSYSANLSYSTKYGWNASETSHDNPIIFDKNNKYDRRCMWATVTEEKK